MTTFNAYANFTYDYLNPSAMGLGIPLSQMPMVTPNLVTVQTTTGYFEIYGNSFSANPPSGQVTAVAFFSGGEKRAEMTSLDLPALDVFNYLMNNDEGDGAYALLNRLINADDIFNLGSANDKVAGLGGNDTINAGAGTDTAIYFSGKSQYDVVADQSGDIIRVVNKSTGETDILNGVEIISFSDGDLRLDLDGNAGQAFRLYQAAFDRTPDQGGLQYWIDRIDTGASLEQAAASFIGSNEFSQTYGSLNNSEFITALYANVFERAPDQAGLDFWVDQLDQGLRNHAQVLVGFSESSENIKLVGPAIEDGIWI